MLKGLFTSCLLAVALAASAQPTPAPGPRWQYAVTPVRPDPVLTRQAFALGQHFTSATWAALAARLQSQPRPVASYLGIRAGRPLYPDLLLLAQKPRHPTLGQQQRWYFTDSIFGGYFGPQYQQAPVSRHATHQLDRHLWALSLERRQTDYERLCQVLRERAAKVTKLEQALPVLKFFVDSTGQVQDVGVDAARSSYGLTKRSRKLILQALAQEQFRALEARWTFSKPRPLAERAHRTSERVGRVLHRVFSRPLLHKPFKPVPCGPYSRRDARRMLRQQRALLRPKP